MIQLPLKQLEKLIKILNKKDYEISNVRLIEDVILNSHFYKDNFRSPLYICYVSYIHNKTEDSIYYVYLIDALSLHIIGKRLQEYPNPITTLWGPQFTKRGIIGINIFPRLYNNKELNPTSYSLHIFIKDMYKLCNFTSTTYKDWVLEFLGKRTAFLSLVSEQYNLMYKLPTMNIFRDELRVMVNKLHKELQTLLDNYPTDA